MSATDDVVATRKLTETETSTLRALLKSQLNITGDAQDDEDAGDLLDYAFAMIANGKAVSYVTEELKSMELEVCTAESAQKVGRCLSNFLRDLDSSGTGTAPKKDESTGKGNALTKSGALGSSRERKNNDAGNKTRSVGKAGTKQQRSVHGAAFDRLRNPSTQRDRSQSERGRGSQKSHMNQSRGHTHNNNVNNRRGHDDRGAGRRGRGGSSDGRGGRQHNNNMSGKRGRQREGEDFVSSALNSGLQSSRTDVDGRGGRGNMQNKRARHEPSNEDNNSEQGAEKWSSNHWQEGRGGRGFSRGGGGGGRMSGRGRGRFSNTFYPNKQANEQEEAAAVSESPLVAGHFSGRHSFRGRGRGRGSFDARGGRAGRAEVAQMISAKTWTRPRTMDEGLSTSR